ncbi:plasmid pRiA4b ORF-3 family protein [Paeniglutamicibacter psychrophenolicus]|uniref:plasmid pRiA4b ORF-3 family protein n=1 Tax=Paeniglutamicibacter psychrophenolicus TaxID=257454 RepID=UPI002784C536|nr:plasmid pRiA4b ORF-3 family protein [Paeniglutamicibacter psychrophenolicus]MDQ0093355.1 hypothetical protein [Paeniglutamicibacter psychrophenolicus]
MNGTSGTQQSPHLGTRLGASTGPRAVLSPAALEVDQLLAPLLPRFLEWFEVSCGSDEDALDCLETIRLVLVEFREVAAKPSITALTSEDAVAVLGKLEAESGDDIFQVLEDFHLYLEFLGQNELWTGTQDDFNDLDYLFGIGDEVPMPELPEITIPVIPRSAELAAFDAMPLLRHATALLEWIDTGKPVTATGTLKLGDIEAAAACVGVAARGAGATKKPRKTEDVLPGFESLMPGTDQGSEAAEAPGTVATVRSMNEVPLLGMVWHGLVAAGLLKVRATTAAPAKGHGLGPDATDRERLDACRKLALCVLRTRAESVMATPMTGPLLWMVNKTALTMGCSTEPLPIDMLAPEGETEPEEELSVEYLLARTALDQFRELMVLGFVELDTHVRVPEHLWAAVKAVFSDDPDQTPVYPQAPANAEKAYEHKVMIQHSSPPIWRRLRVPAGIPLDEFHHLIQASFDWDNSHLHLFRKPGKGGTFYSNEYVETVPWEEAHIDESTVLLAQVLQNEKESLFYEYDFGDNWQHRITLEKILETQDAGPLPSCTGGRGMAPADDTGGPWGWASKVEASNDPAHPDYEWLRQWFGLEDGDVLDPKAFDKRDVNTALKNFR